MTVHFHVLDANDEERQRRGKTQDTLYSARRNKRPLGFSMGVICDGQWVWEGDANYDDGLGEVFTALDGLIDNGSANTDFRGEKGRPNDVLSWYADAMERLRSSIAASLRDGIDEIKRKKDALLGFGGEV